MAKVPEKIFVWTAGSVVGWLLVWLLVWVLGTLWAAVSSLGLANGLGSFR